MHKLKIFSKVKSSFVSINIGSVGDIQKIWMLGLINFKRFIIFPENLRNDSSNIYYKIYNLVNIFFDNLISFINNFLINHILNISRKVYKL